MMSRPWQGETYAAGNMSSFSACSLFSLFKMVLQSVSGALCFLLYQINAVLFGSMPLLLVCYFFVSFQK